MSKTLRACGVALIVAATTVVAAKESVSIQVSPAVSFAPADLVIQARIEPDSNNRTIAIVADSQDFFRSTAIQLEGDRAPKTTTVTFHSVPPGDYSITATVIGVDGRSRLARATVQVLDPH